MTTHYEPTQGPLGLYFDRWQALDTLIRDTWANYVGQPLFDRKDTILSLLDSLRAFAHGQFDFFYYGFDPQAYPQSAAPRPRLQTWDEYPAEDVLTGILLQIGHDLELIQRAATQRISGGDIARDTLKRADTLAWCAMQPAIERNIIEKPTTVLTHFEKSAEFYNIPYAPIALIAIPFSCTAQNTHQDYLAIPHEVGHYVYRHPTVQVKVDFDRLRLSADIDPDYKDWVKSVFEEMCADIYGCLVGGPVMARDFEDLALANSQKDFRDGDGQHPNAALRPLIYCDVLANPVVDVLTEGAWHNIGRLLSDQWGKQLYRRHVSEFGVTTNVAQGQDQLIKNLSFNIDDALNRGGKAKAVAGRQSVADVVHDVVKAMLQQLADYVASNQPIPPEHKVQGWAGLLAADTLPTELLPQFEDNFARLSEAPECKPPEAGPPPVDLWRAWATKKNPILKTWSGEDPIPSGEVKDPDQMKPNSWGYILSADGWATGGPGIDPGHPGIDPGHPGIDPGHPLG